VHKCIRVVEESRQIVRRIVRADDGAIHERVDVVPEAGGSHESLDLVAVLMKPPADGGTDEA